MQRPPDFRERVACIEEKMATREEVDALRSTVESHRKGAFGGERHSVLGFRASRLRGPRLPVGEPVLHRADARGGEGGEAGDGGPPRHRDGGGGAPARGADHLAQDSVHQAAVRVSDSIATDILSGHGGGDDDVAIPP